MYHRHANTLCTLLQHSSLLLSTKKKGKKSFLFISTKKKKMIAIINISYYIIKKTFLSIAYSIKLCRCTFKGYSYMGEGNVYRTIRFISFGGAYHLTTRLPT